MAKEQFQWEPEILEKMSTDEIESKMKTFVPGFNLADFSKTTERYLSSEELAEEEYYPIAKFSYKDEDFIWMACYELWKRVAPGRPAAEHLADDFDDKIDQIVLAIKKNQKRKVANLHEQAFQLIFPYIIGQTESGYRLKRDFYEKFAESSLFNVKEFFEGLVVSLLEVGKYARIEELATLLTDVLEDDFFLSIEALSLVKRGNGNAADRLYQDLLKRHPDYPWFAIDAGEAFTHTEKPDYVKGKKYYLKALSIAKATPGMPDGEDAISTIYEGLIDIAKKTGDAAEALRYQKLLESHRPESFPDKIVDKKIGRNDPCPCGSGKKHKKCCGQSGTNALEALAPDRRLMERSLLGLTQMISKQHLDSADEINHYLESVMKDGMVHPWIPETPLEKAQSLIFDALESSGKERIELARQALKKSPDCADAYVLLAEEQAQSLEEMLSLYEAGVKAGERALGEEAFRDQAGHFWSSIETRPYMRARHGLANCLWALGKRPEAIEHYRDMLRLNPNDNQGIRYLLASSLLELDEIDDLQKLLKQYDDPTADWLYTEALVSFLRNGNCPRARKQLLEAFKHNRYIVPYLLGEKRLPKNIPEEVTLGEESEAVVYADQFGDGWLKSEGALHWLASVCRSMKAPPEKDSASIDIPDVFIRAFESRGRTQEHAQKAPMKIYTFKVSLKHSPEIWRTIEIKGDQSLDQLHKAVFKAYERFDEHLYAFFLSNKPWDSSTEYGPPNPESKARNAGKTKIDSLGLAVKKKFLYLFDFGDEWWHTVQLLEISEKEAKGKYPRVVETAGKSPPQYDEGEE